MKEHAARTARTELVTRLRLAGTHPAFVPPLVSRPLTTRDGRPLTVWPRVAVATPTDPALPWAEAGRLLAGLRSPGRTPRRLAGPRAPPGW
ncbi:MAG: hypothetical protein IPL41_09080 [Micropruina sp.]|nr:hypothetical protein [Micropruina sp.]